MPSSKNKAENTSCRHIILSIDTIECRFLLPSPGIHQIKMKLSQAASSIRACSPRLHVFSSIFHDVIAAEPATTSVRRNLRLSHC